MKSLLLEHIGAFIRWAIGGFRQEFRTILETKPMLNMIIGLSVLFVFVFISIKGIDHFFDNIRLKK